MEKRYEYITPNDYETADVNGITSSALEQRVYSYGWDIDRAIIQPMRESTSFQGVWEKWEHVATENGISRRLFYQRIRGSKWLEERAATQAISQGKPLSIEWTVEEREIAKRNGLDKNYMNIVKTRISNGWTREEALRTPKISEKERAQRVAAGTRKYHKERGVNSGFNKKNRAMGN